ncbi:hypothetical protein [Phenylobacterium soli]|nr:hypothetical protein [Phenylobacterium soli]
MTRIFTHRAAGVAWCLMALSLAVVLGVTTAQSRRQEDFLKGRIAALATHDASQLQAELVSCRATVRSYASAASAVAARQVQAETTPVKAARQDPRALAAELANTPPAGFDVCARMESADQAVLKALDRR